MITRLLLAIFAATAVAAAARAPGAETTADLRGLLREGLAAGRPRIVIPPGRYRVTPERHEHLRLEGLTNVEIEGNRIAGCPRPGIRVEATKGLRLSGNRLDLLPGDGRPVELENAETVTGDDAPGAPP